MAQQQPDFSDSIPDPDQMLQDQADLYSKEIAQSRSSQDFNASVSNRGAQLFGGGGQKVLEAQQLKTRMQQIMSQANANADPNEDPLTKNMRVASLMGQGLIDLNPQLAMKAMEQAGHYQEAIKQQGYINAETSQATANASHLGAETQDLQNKNALFANSPHTMVLAQDQGKDKDELPLGYSIAGSYDVMDPASSAKMKNDIAVAAQNGTTLVPMTEQEFFNNKQNLAVSNGQYSLQKAQIAAMAREYAANQKSQNQTQDRFTNRILSQADVASTGLAQIAQMPFGVTSAGYFSSAKPGSSLLTAPASSLKQALTTEDQQAYNTLSQSLWRSIGGLEAQGGIQGMAGVAMQVKDALALNPQDNQSNVLMKLAEARQIIDTTTGIYMADPNLNPEKKALLRDKLDELKKQIPWNPLDVINYMKQENPGKQTFGEYAASKGVGGIPASLTFKSPDDVPPGIKPGTRISIDGKPGTWH